MGRVGQQFWPISLLLAETGGKGGPQDFKNLDLDPSRNYLLLPSQKVPKPPQKRYHDSGQSELVTIIADPDSFIPDPDPAAFLEFRIRIQPILFRQN